MSRYLGFELKAQVAPTYNKRLENLIIANDRAFMVLTWFLSGFRMVLVSDIWLWFESLIFHGSWFSNSLRSRAVVWFIVSTHCGMVDCGLSFNETSKALLQSLPQRV